jgi:hypothetical protein
MANAGCRRSGGTGGRLRRPRSVGHGCWRVGPPVSDASGLIVYSTPRATVGLIVRDGRVVDCPPYARKWAMGRDARELWRDGKRKGAQLVWLPD